MNTFEDVRQCSYENADGDLCDFEGVVEITVDDYRATAWWECPLCKWDNDEEVGE